MNFNPESIFTLNLPTLRNKIPRDNIVKTVLNYGAVRASDIDDFGTAETVGIDDELDGLAVSEASKALRLDRRLVDEEIGLAVGSDESKALPLVERLNHFTAPFILDPLPSAIGSETTHLSQTITTLVLH